MKLQRLFMLGLMVTSIALITSCSDGEDGADGADGKSITGPAGTAGADGIDCWDTDGDGVNDADEDINDDGNFDALDCQTGLNGANGDNGLACWDLDGDGIGTIDHEDQTVNEDLNFDNVVDVLDCQGTDGNDGSQGQPGQPGQDGNANVIRGEMAIPANPNFLTFFDFSIAAITGIPVQEVGNYAYLFYLVESNSFHVSNIPGPVFINDFHTTVMVRYDSAGSGFCLFIELEQHGQSTSWDDEFASFRVVAMEVTTDNKGGQADPIKALKAAGVDTKDYHAVMTYFGLE